MNYSLNVKGSLDLKIDIVAYGSVVTQWPFLGNISINMFPLLCSRFLIMQQLDAAIEELCFLCGPCRDVNKEGTTDSSVDFCTGGYKDRTWALEAEESLLLKPLPENGWWRHSGGAVITCTYKSCVKVVNKSSHSTKPRLWSLIHVTIYLNEQDIRTVYVNDLYLRGTKSFLRS
jgi:hypothetical protein